MADTPHWIIGADLPDLTGTWTDNDGNLIDLTDYTLVELRVGREGAPALLVKTTGVTLAETDPNVTVTWDVDELDVLDPNKTYTGVLIVERTADSKERRMPFTLYMQDTVAAATP